MNNEVSKLTPEARSLSLKRNKEAFLLARKNRTDGLLIFYFLEFFSQFSYIFL